MTAGTRSLLLTSILIALVVAIAGGLTWHFSSELHANRLAGMRTVQTIDTARTLLSLVQDAETGQRGFLITGRPSYLEPYRVAVAAIPARADALAELVADSPDQSDRAKGLRSLLDLKIAELQRTVALMQQGDEAGAVAIIQEDQGKIAMDQIRLLIGEVVAAENALLDERIARSNQSQRRALYTAIFGFALALTALAIGAALLIRNNRHLRQAESQLARQRMLLQSTLDSCHNGIAAFDAAGALAAYNRGFFELLDFPEHAARAGISFAALRELERGRAAQALADPVEGAGDGCVEAVVGQRNLEVYRDAMPDGGFVLSVLDTTRRIQAEAAIRQAQKMEAVGRLTGGIAHDFNNTLQVIASNVDLLSRELPEGSDVERRARNVALGVERGARLTAQLLAFARLQPLNPQVINLGQLVGETTELLRRSLGEQVEIETVVAGGLWNTLADRTQIENAILNLAINGRDAMPGGGKLTIEASNASLDDIYAAQHEEVKAGQYVVLAVTDTGSGMSHEVMARAFEPFFTTKSDGEGTGLGLSQVYGFVKQSGGHIKLYSELGVGTTVKIYLPRSWRPHERSTPWTAAPAQGRGETVLVIEDDAAVRLVAVELLRELGYEVLVAAGAEPALSILANGAKVDVLFTDIVMPGPIGTPEMVRRARQIAPDLGVLYTSGYTENAVIHNGQLDPGVLLLTKPYSRSDLARRIKLALDQRPKAAGTPEPSASTILVVEDEPLIRVNTCEMLKDLGHRAIEAASGTAAVEQIRTHPEIAILLTDIMLPDLSGAELIRIARELRPELRMVACTGHAASTELQEMDGGLIVLQKPFTRDELRRVLEQCGAASA